jgi:omega-6 fatty acid desaturase (delta-12 desaturase)
LESEQVTARPLPSNALHWARILRNYREPNHGRSIYEIGATLVPFLGFWALAWAAIHFGYWEVSPILWILTAGFLVRLFMIQHDCGHGAFFRRRRANDWIGRIIGVLTLTPYESWRRNHAQHHAGTGNLDRRGIGDITTLSVREFRALSRWGRILYRGYRHPLVMFGIGPAYVFLLRQRLPDDLIRSNGRVWISAMASNLASAVVVTVLIWFIGIGPFLLIYLPITLIAASIGVWLFYLQHQFEQTSWEHDGEWNLQVAALHGSSHYDLPRILRWFTASIGVHHVHHLCSRIPFYRLPHVLHDHPSLGGTNRLSLVQSLGCVRLALWDETQRRLVTFRDARS